MKVNRLAAYIIDNIIISFVTVIIFTLILGFFYLGGDSHGVEGAIPFVILLVSCCPISTSLYIVVYTVDVIVEGGISDILTALGPIIFVLIVIIFQTLLLSIVEICTSGKTVGRKAVKIKVISDDDEYTIRKATARNFIKVSSKYLFYTPFVSLLWNKNNKTIYDKWLGTSVVYNIFIDRVRS